MAARVGVLGIQGDFDKHVVAIHETDPATTPMVVRTEEELAAVDRLIIPGGESTTVGLLLDRFGLGQVIQRRAQEGMPIWGTCMGMILLAQDIEERPEQPTLGLLDVTVRRNAFGAQVHSFEDLVPVDSIGPDVLGVFIRAPEVTRLGEGVVALARYKGRIVAVRQGNILGTSFHPELTADRRFHRWFLSL